MLLLTDAGLLIRSYLAVLDKNRGFSESTLTMSINVDDQAQNSDRIRRRLMDAIQTLPGVRFAGSIDDLPLSTYEDKGFLEIEGYASKRYETVSVRETGGDYFRSMRIALISGRYLKDSDAVSTGVGSYPTVAAVSQSFALKYFPGADPVGHRLRINGSRWARIVGVVGDVRHTSLEEEPEPIVYYQTGLADSVVIRTNGASGPVIQSVAKTLKDLAPTASVTDIRSMNSYVDDASARRRFQTAALTVFAIVAVFLMLVGLYGLLSFMVGHRRREIGIRMAVGASKSAIFRMTIRYGMKLTLTGLVVGTFLTLILTRVMTSFLYGVQAIDPQTLVFVPALVISLALVACVAPAYTAARIEPVRVLEQP